MFILVFKWLDTGLVSQTTHVHKYVSETHNKTLIDGHKVSNTLSTLKRRHATNAQNPVNGMVLLNQEEEEATASEQCKKLYLN